MKFLATPLNATGCTIKADRPLTRDSLNAQ